MPIISLNRFALLILFRWAPKGSIERTELGRGGCSILPRSRLLGSRRDFTFPLTAVYALSGAQLACSSLITPSEACSARCRFFQSTLRVLLILWCRISNVFRWYLSKTVLAVLSLEVGLAVVYSHANGKDAYHMAEDHSQKAETHDGLIQATIEAANAANEAAKAAQAKTSAVQALAKLPEANEAVNALIAAAKKVEEVAKTAKRAADTKVVVSLSAKSIFSDSEKRQPKVNKWQMGIAFGIFVFGLCLVANDWLVAHGHILIHSDDPFWLALAPIILVDLFLAGLLRAVALRGTNEHEPPPYIPDRWPAVFILVCFYCTFVLSFAHLNRAARLTTTIRESLFEGLLTVAKLEHANYKIGDSLLNQSLVAGELLSVVLLFFVFFPLLVARLALFKGDTISMSDLRTICKPDAELSDRLEFTLEADSSLVWNTSKDCGGVQVSSKKVTLKVNEKGKARISNGN